MTRLRRLGNLGAGLALLAGATLAQATSPFDQLPAPQPTVATPSHAPTDEGYREDAARHVYAAYPGLVLRGLVPAYVYAIAVTQTDVDAQGRVLDVRLVREPAQAKEVGPWVMGLVRQLGWLPAPRQRTGATWVDVWLVDSTGLFQLDTLTEGQQP
jgi:periplasmic protein TonB